MWAGSACQEERPNPNEFLDLTAGASNASFCKLMFLGSGPNSTPNLLTGSCCPAEQNIEKGGPEGHHPRRATQGHVQESVHPPSQMSSWVKSENLLLRISEPLLPSCVAFLPVSKLNLYWQRWLSGSVV